MKEAAERLAGEAKGKGAKGKTERRERGRDSSEGKTEEAEGF